MGLSNFQRSNLPDSIQPFQPHGDGAATLLFRHYDARFTDGFRNGTDPNRADHGTSMRLGSTSAPGCVLSRQCRPMLEGKVALGIQRAGELMHGTGTRQNFKSCLRDAPGDEPDVDVRAALACRRRCALCAPTVNWSAGCCKGHGHTSGIHYMSCSVGTLYSMASAGMTLGIGFDMWRRP